MAKCGFCGKGVSFGIQVSHSHRRSNRTFKPNIRRVKAIINKTSCHVNVCTRCLRSGRVQRGQGFEHNQKEGSCKRNSSCLLYFKNK